MCKTRVKLNRKTESNPVRNSESKQVRNVGWINLETVARAELPMPTTAIASDTWHVNGQALDAAAEFSKWSWIQWICWDFIHIHRHNIDIDIIPCNGVAEWFPGGVVCTPEYWRVRVFGPYDIVNIPSDRLSVYTIPQSIFMDRCYRYKIQINWCFLVGSIWF